MELDGMVDVMVELSSKMQKLVELASQKHWHQFTQEAIAQFPKLSVQQQQQVFLEIIVPNVSKLNQYKVAHLALFSDFAHVQLADDAQKLLDLQSIIATQQWTKLSDIATSPVINQQYYYTHLVKNQVQADFSQFYRNSFLYLSALSKEDLISPAQQKFIGGLPDSLAVAALLSADIYNFSELLLHPIYSQISSGTKELLTIFNKGDISGFEKVKTDLDRNFLRQKLCLMSLVEVVFKTQAKVLKFTTIATETKLPMDDIEHLLMRALSLGLVKGLIDQVKSEFVVEYVQPRVLDPSQIVSLKDQISVWSTRVGELGQQTAVQV